MPNSGRISPVYNCRESRRAREKLNALADADPRFQILWNGVIWLIQRNPHSGSLIPGKTVTYVIITYDFLVINMPILEVYYTIVADDLFEVLEIHD